MAEFMAYRIADEKMAYSRAPKSLRPAINECLKELNAEHFIVEEDKKEEV